MTCGVTPLVAARPGPKCEVVQRSRTDRRRSRRPPRRLPDRGASYSERGAAQEKGKARMSAFPRPCRASLKTPRAGRSVRHLLATGSSQHLLRAAASSARTTPPAPPVGARCEARGREIRAGEERSRAKARATMLRIAPGIGAHPPLEGEGRSERPRGSGWGELQAVSITPPRRRFAPPTLPLKRRVNANAEAPHPTTKLRFARNDGLNERRRPAPSRPPARDLLAPDSWSWLGKRVRGSKSGHSRRHPSPDALQV